MNDRLTILAEKLPQGMDAALITSPINRRYYTGFASSAGTIVVFRDKSYFIIDSRYHEVALTVVKNCEVILQDKINTQIGELLQKHGAKVLGVECAETNVSDFLRYREAFPGVEIPMDNRLSDLIVQQRQMKSTEEIRYIQQAQDIADETFAYILEVIQPGMTEREIALDMELYSRQNGSEEAAFSFIVAAGPNSSRPHAVPGDYQVQVGDFIVMDYGATVSGYRSDMTRTVALGQVSDKHREVHELVLKAQLESLKAIAPGASCREVDKVARDIIDATAYKGLFGHGLGHSIGLEVHENPRFNTESTAVLEPGMIMSVEPGIYLPGELGVRIEDIVAITPDGYHNFAASPKELIVL